MAIKQYKSTKKYKCPYCGESHLRGDLISHVDKKHKSLIPEGYDATRVVYDSINKTDHGKCMICGKPVYTWDPKHCKYANLCNNPKCREEVRRIALERHIRVYNKPTLLNDPDQQEKMLAHRRISGSYKFSDGGVVNYTGKYERNALEFIDKVMGYKSYELEVPGPVLTYDFNGVEHNYIPDLYIIPANLLIEIKDGGSNPNNRSMPEYRAKQIAKEKMVTDLGTMNYLRLTNNQFDQLLAILADIKLENLDHSDDPAKKFHINEAACPSCGGGVPASCATFPKSLTISMEKIPTNGELAPCIFSVPESDDAIYVDNDWNKHKIKKSEFDKSDFGCMFEFTGNVQSLYNELLNSKSPMSIKEVFKINSGRDMVSLSELALDSSKVKYYNIELANRANKFIQNAFNVAAPYVFNESILHKTHPVYTDCEIYYCPEGFFATIGTPAMATEVVYTDTSLEEQIKLLKEAFDYVNQYHFI